MKDRYPAPMSFWMSLPFFGLPWLLFMLATYVVIPTLGRTQVPLFVIFLVSLGTSLALLALASLVAYRLEGGEWTWNAFRYRFRLGPVRRATWWWTLGLSVFMFLAPELLSFSREPLLKISPMPDALARMFQNGPGQFMGTSLAGAWWLVLGYLAFVVINVSGEELWWRGYILPRQEMCMGRWTWLVHGMLWNLFHSFFYWELILLLPGCLALSYVAQRSRNTWPGIIAHLSYSIPTLIALTVGVLQ